MKIQVLDEAEDDLQDGREFYNRQELGVGDYSQPLLQLISDSSEVDEEGTRGQTGLTR